MEEVPVAVVGIFDCEGVVVGPLNKGVVESVGVEDEDDEEEEAVDNGDASAEGTTVVDEDVVVEVVVEVLCVGETTVLVGVE